jgi:hypothetical protein
VVATETFGPFDTQAWTDQTQWYRFGPTWAPSGVIDTPAASASAGSLGITFSGLTPTLSAGRAWVRGAGYELSGGSKTMTAVPANTNSSLSRRDRIVLRRDLSAKTVALTAIQGTPASTPVAPALTQVETGQWDTPLFSFLVPPNSGTVITGITDERVWVDPGGNTSINATGRVPISTTTQVASTTALTSTITVPAVGVPYRVVFTAMGHGGFAGSDTTLAWDWDTFPAAATLTSADTVDQVLAVAGKWASVVSTLTVEMPASQAATARLILRSSASVYNRGSVVWHRSPIV